MKVAALISGGKDSLFALWKEIQKGNELVCIVTLKSKNQESYMFHTPAIDLTKLQAEAMNIPIIFKTTQGEKEKELEDLKSALLLAKERYGAEGIVSGAIKSTYQKGRIESVCSDLKLQSLTPLWDSEPLLQWNEMIKEGFKIILVGVAAEGLTETWVGREMNKEAVYELSHLHNTCYICTAGEGGEFESLVLDCPLFSKKIKIEESHKNWDKKTESGILVIDKARLVNK